MFVNKIAYGLQGQPFDKIGVVSPLACFITSHPMPFFLKLHKIPYILVKNYQNLSKTKEVINRYFTFNPVVTNKTANESIIKIKQLQ